MQPFGACFHFERDVLTFSQGAKAITLNGTEVHEHVFSTIFWRDETVTLGVIEPFHSTSTHRNYLTPLVIIPVEAGLLKVNLPKLQGTEQYTSSFKDCY